MKITPRELGLAWLTFAALLLGGGYWWAEPRFKALQEREAAIELLEREKQLAEYEMSRRNEWEAQLAEYGARLPSHPKEARVLADLLRRISELAEQNGLLLPKQTPQEERAIGDLYELSVICDWEGSLEALTRFLYAVQAEGVVLDIRKLEVRPSRGDVERLAGKFTVDYAYRRDTAREKQDEKPGNT